MADRGRKALQVASTHDMVELHQACLASELHLCIILLVP